MIDEEYPDLTPREQQILRLLAEGRDPDEIHDALVIARSTVKTHKRSLQDKFNVHRHGTEERGRSEERDLSEKLWRKAAQMGYLPTPRYILKEKIAQLSNENVEIHRAIESFHGYGPDKEIFYKLLISKSPGEFQRFKHEVDVLSRIKHDNILDLHDFGWMTDWEENSHPFFTMPYRANRVGILKACKDSPEKIDNFLFQLLNVLGYLHWRGIIFNHLRTQNIFVADGKVLLMDFGESVLLGTAPVSTSLQGERQAASAPQVFAGGISVQSDLRAFGLLIHQILTSNPHSLGPEPPTPEAADQMIHELRKRPADRAMAGIVEKLVSSESESCFQSALEVTEALLEAKRGRFDQNRAFSKWVKGFSRMEPIGRGEVLGQLNSALRQLFEARRGGMYLIVGEAGVGKSALLKQVRREARGFDGPEALLSYVKIEKKASVNRGYTMWRDTLLRLIEAAERTGLTGETARAIKSLQELLDPSDTTATVMDSDGRTEQAALHLFRNLKAKKGIKNKVVVLLLDDLQRMGDDSFRLLQKLYKDMLRLNLPVLIVGTYKEHDPNEDRMLKEISRGLKLPSTALIKLEKLTTESSQQLSRYLLSTLNLHRSIYQVEIDGLMQIISARSRGFPLRVIRYVQVAAQYDRLDSTKAELDQIWSSEAEADDEVVTWLESNRRLDDQSLIFLATIALLDRRVDLDVLKAIYPDEKELKSLLYACYDAGVLVEDNQQVKFLHDSVHEAARKFLPGQAEEIYKAVASAIEKTYSSNLVVYSSQLADLWEKAEDRKNAASYYLIAARFEINKSAYDAARGHAEKIIHSELDAELQRLEQSEIRLIQYFAYMGLGKIDLAHASARNALDLLGYRTVSNSHFGLDLIKAALQQIGYRLRTGTSKQKKTIDELYEFRIAVRCHRALAQLEYFNNNFWRVLYYMLEGLNLCDEIGDDGRGQKADLYAAATVIASPLGPGILSKLIASQYEELAQNDLDKSGDKALELWMRLVLGMYYGSIGRWSDANRHLERGLQLGMEGIDQRRRYEVVAILYLCSWYSGEWEAGRSRNNYLRELVREDKVDPGSLSQTDLWPPLFESDRLLYTGEFEQDEIPLKQVCLALANVDQAAWLRGLGVLAQMYLRRRELTEAEKTANQFFDSVLNRPVMPFYATEGFFGALDVYLELLEHDVKSKDLRKKIKKLLYYLLDQPILAFSKRYPIAKPRSLLYRARYVLITTSRKDKAKRFANLALWHAQELKMPYDEGLIHEFIGAHLCDDSGRDDLKRAFEIFDQLGAIWNRDRVGERLANIA